jgi:hypothetical protein
MGFWSGVNKLMQGKPVFEDQPTVRDKITGAEQSSQTGVQPDNNQFTDQNGKKIIPQVEVGQVESHIQGDTITVTAWVKNLSGFAIELDKITILSRKTELDRPLSPQQAHEVTLYKGSLLKSDNDHKVVLQYKIVENGDYFSVEYVCEFKYESNGTYTVKALRPAYGVRDI